MSEAAHTAGPWQQYHPEHDPLHIVGNVDQGAHGDMIFTVIVDEVGGGDRASANARLIAAAPDLLEALQDLLDDTQHATHNCGDTVENCPVLAARAAIAKARGASS